MGVESYRPLDPYGDPGPLPLSTRYGEPWCESESDIRSGDESSSRVDLFRGYVCSLHPLFWTSSLTEIDGTSSPPITRVNLLYSRILVPTSSLFSRLLLTLLELLTDH